MTPDDPLDRLHRDLGLKRLNGLWAKLEILLGLFAVGCGLVAPFWLAMMHPRFEASEWMWLVPILLIALGGYLALVPILLIALGGYLALAGHRSHLYQSNNNLVAYLAELIRNPKPPKPENPQ